MRTKKPAEAGFFLKQGLAHPINQQVDFRFGDREGRGETQGIGAAMDDAIAVFAHPFFRAVGAIAFELR